MIYLRSPWVSVIVASAACVIALLVGNYVAAAYAAGGACLAYGQIELMKAGKH